MAELTPGERAVMNYRAKGLSYNEIAKLLDISRDRVNQAIVRATLKIAEARGAKILNLSTREREILNLIESGITDYTTLAKELSVSRDRVKSLIWSLKRKGWLPKVRIVSLTGKNTSFSKKVKKSGKKG